MVACGSGHKPRSKVRGIGHYVVFLSQMGKKDRSMVVSRVGSFYGAPHIGHVFKSLRHCAFGGIFSTFLLLGSIELLE